eukprot:7407177-Alexandrium_andersonii.AAC.1
MRRSRTAAGGAAHRRPSEPQEAPNALWASHGPRMGPTLAEQAWPLPQASATSEPGQPLGLQAY